SRRSRWPQPGVGTRIARERISTKVCAPRKVARSLFSSLASTASAASLVRRCHFDTQQPEVTNDASPSPTRPCCSLPRCDHPRARRHPGRQGWRQEGREEEGRQEERRQERREEGRRREGPALTRLSPVRRIFCRNQVRAEGNPSALSVFSER